MSLPDYFKLSAGTEISWKQSGGTYAISLASVANGGARQGAKGDLGSTWHPHYVVLFSSAVAAAATSGRQIELYWAESPSATAGTDNPGNTSGTDSAYSNPDQYKYQLVFLGSLVLANAAGTDRQTVMLHLFPRCRYGFPVVVNDSGQTLHATADRHEIRLIPIQQAVVDNP